MPNHVPMVRCTKAQHSSMCTSLSSAGVSWHRVMGRPSYARNCTCALPSPLPFHYVMAKIVPAMQHLVQSKFLCLKSTTISYHYGAMLHLLQAPLLNLINRRNEVKNIQS